MPLTPGQLAIARLLAPHRSPDSHLAGGAALHFSPNSKRYSNDLDFFQDSEERVASAFQQDREALEEAAYEVEVEIRQPGYIRAIVSNGEESTKIEWAHDSAWRFMPPIEVPASGFQLHPVDLAVNKVLALAGRDEARDFYDVLHIDSAILALGALVWAAVGKDPGFTPFSLLELIKRRGKYQPEDFSRLRLAEPVDLVAMKGQWLRALEKADEFIRSRPAKEAGCLYYSPAEKRFIAPTEATKVTEDPQADALARTLVPHHGRPGGVLPRFFGGDVLAENLSRLERIE